MSEKKLKKAIDKAVQQIKSAANGMSGAASVGDIAYIQQRRADLGFAAESLRRNGGGVKVDVDAIVAKADKIVEAGRRKDMHAANTLNIEIGELLAPLCD